MNRNVWVLGLMVVFLGGGQCGKVAKCTSDADCGGGNQCRADGYCGPGEAEAPDAGDPVNSSSAATSQAGSGSSLVSVSSSVGASSRASSSSGSGQGSSSAPASSGRSSSLAPPSSSFIPDAGPTTCPGVCSDPSGSVATWGCQDGGTAPSACTPATCAAGLAHCTAGPGTCETNTQTDLAHCGSCNGAVGREGTQCLAGTPLCFDIPACQADGGTPICAQLPSSSGVCVQCAADADCPSGTPVCCGGTCKAVSDACGCELAVGGAPGATCAAATGGACLNPADGTMVALGNSQLGTLAAVHGGQCGCSPAAGLPVPVAQVCAAVGPFQGLCASAAGGPVGQCQAQNTPVATSTTGAGNCGSVGNTCDVSKGGLECLPVSGVGSCGCTAGAQGNQGCAAVLPVGGGRTAKVADTCTNGGTCDCAGQAGTGICSGSTPDCCGNGCKDLKSDPANCGACGVAVAAHREADSCSNGALRCGATAACGGSTQVCLAGVCRQCGADTDCGAGTMCCGSQCVPYAQACGCGIAVGGTPGTVCDANGAGGRCVGATGAVLVANGTLQGGTTAAQVHNGRCGCGAPDNALVADTTNCALNGGFVDMCRRDVDGGSFGTCSPQNTPAIPAENCGGADVTCSPTKGGAGCVADGSGVGHCQCQPASRSFECYSPTLDSNGRLHSVATFCGQGTLDPRPLCGCYQTGVTNLTPTSVHACDPNSALSDCCPGSPQYACMDLRADPYNCGTCASTCAAGKSCLNGDCQCSVAADCSTYARGNNACTAGLCTCGSTGAACPPSTVCIGSQCCGYGSTRVCAGQCCSSQTCRTFQGMETGCGLF